MSDELTADLKTPDDVVASEADERPTATPLAAETLVARVHGSFAKSRKWDDVPVELVREVVAGLDLAREERSHPTPPLRVHRLRFQGEKTLNDGTRSPVEYDQRFRPGVNVLLVQDNSVGKSSVFKTIKFALTGDDTDYDSDVRSWIVTVCLHFSIGGAPHTIHLQRTDDRVAGYIAAGHVDAGLVGMDTTDVVTLARMSNGDAVRDELHRFFLDRFGLDQLGWTDSSKGMAEERRITWRTFFQALTIPDSSEQYLLVSDKNAIGNQEGLPRRLPLDP